MSKGDPMNPRKVIAELQRKIEAKVSNRNVMSFLPPCQNLPFMLERMTNTSHEALMLVPERNDGALLRPNTRMMLASYDRFMEIQRQQFIRFLQESEKAAIGSIDTQQSSGQSITASENDRSLILSTDSGESSKLRKEQNAIVLPPKNHKALEMKEKSFHMRSKSSTERGMKLPLVKKEMPSAQVADCSQHSQNLTDWTSKSELLLHQDVHRDSNKNISKLNVPERVCNSPDAALMGTLSKGTSKCRKFMQPIIVPEAGQISKTSFSEENPEDSNQKVSKSPRGGKHTAASRRTKSPDDISNCFKIPQPLRVCKTRKLSGPAKNEEFLGGSEKKTGKNNILPILERPKNDTQRKNLNIITNNEEITTCSDKKQYSRSGRMIKNPSPYWMSVNDNQPVMRKSYEGKKSKSKSVQNETKTGGMRKSKLTTSLAKNKGNTDKINSQSVRRKKGGGDLDLDSRKVNLKTKQAGVLESCLEIRNSLKTKQNDKSIIKSDKAKQKQHLGPGGSHDECPPIHEKAYSLRSTSSKMNGVKSHQKEEDEIPSSSEDEDLPLSSFIKRGRVDKKEVVPSNAMFTSLPERKKSARCKSDNITQKKKRNAKKTSKKERLKCKRKSIDCEPEFVCYFADGGANSSGL